MLPIEPCNEIYFPCFHFISSRYAVRRIGFFFCLLRNESFLVKFFFIFFCVPRFIVHFFFFFFLGKKLLKNDSPIYQFLEFNYYCLIIVYRIIGISDNRTFTLIVRQKFEKCAKTSISINDFIIDIYMYTYFFHFLNF